MEKTQARGWRKGCLTSTDREETLPWFSSTFDKTAAKRAIKYGNNLPSLKVTCPTTENILLDKVANFTNICMVDGTNLYPTIQTL